MKPTVYVVDDDAGIREALDEMLTLAGMGVVTCASAGDYFRVPRPDLPSCLILDVALPDAELGISETTLQIHRSRVMRKMEAESLAQLVRMAGKLAVPLPLGVPSAGK